MARVHLPRSRRLSSGDMRPTATSLPPSPSVPANVLDGRRPGGVILAVLELLERQAGAGVPLTVKSFHLGGFTR